MENSTKNSDLDDIVDIPISTSGDQWTSKIECSCTNEPPHHHDDIDDDVSHTHEDQMNEVELWQQLEHELNEGDEAADMVNEIRDEEAEAIAEVDRLGEEASATPQTK